MCRPRILLLIVVWMVTTWAATCPALASEETENDRMLESLRFKGLDGIEHRLIEWKGRVIVLNFWASWCAPCQAEIRDFVRYQDEYAGRGLQIVGIGMDEEHKLRNVGRTLGINYPVLLTGQDSSQRVLTEWGNPRGVVPYTVIIDRTGKPSYIHRGPMEDDLFRKYVLSLL